MFTTCEVNKKLTRQDELNGVCEGGHKPVHHTCDEQVTDQ